MNDFFEKPCGAEISSLSKIFKNELKKISAKRGINSTYAKIIMMLSQNSNEVIQNEIVENTNLKPSTISLTLKSLEQMGYLTRETSIDDSRKVIVRITNLGLKYDQEIRKCFKLVEEEMIKGIDEEEIKIFKSVITKMKNNLLQERGDN